MIQTSSDVKDTAVDQKKRSHTYMRLNRSDTLGIYILINNEHCLNSLHKRFLQLLFLFEMISSADGKSLQVSTLFFWIQIVSIWCPSFSGSLSCRDEGHVKYSHT